MPKRLKQCPLCGKPTDPQSNWYPFCGERCRTQDLANWSTEAYTVAGPLTEADENLDSAAADPDADARE